MNRSNVIVRMFFRQRRKKSRTGGKMARFKGDGLIQRRKKAQKEKQSWWQNGSFQGFFLKDIVKGNCNKKKRNWRTGGKMARFKVSF